MSRLVESSGGASAHPRPAVAGTDGAGDRNDLRRLPEFSVAPLEIRWTLRLPVRHFGGVITCSQRCHRCSVTSKRGCDSIAG